MFTMKFARHFEFLIEILVLCARVAAYNAVTTYKVALVTSAKKNHAARIVMNLIRHGFLVDACVRSILLVRPVDLGEGA
ncbi:hypothetical protein [Brucella pseudogrignonensis]|uniref:DNA-binding IscR family transcriptional regulator n=1 Tax=Brucella pseudogrignonensis TaxID=419475 RepID=A0ABU1MBE9_9HYPH|nr:hypothetical protein [Brucella pseudogrignonensis]MDR6433372.1 DNA-binding IscR family transcriptional regulator [Brucella pseudogrignonensis]